MLARARCRSLLALLTASAATLAPAAALACGGLFCSQPVGPTTGPAPVDQTAERIIFEVDDGTISAHVQIQYTGSADEFAWVVPVPSNPTVEESSDAYFQSLDAASQLSVVLPPPETCPGATPPAFATGGDDDGGCGCGMLEADSAGSSEQGNGNIDPRSPGQDPVTVHARDYTANYEFAVIEAAQAQDLVDWLLENRFNVSENMVPVMQPYVDEGMLFLGLKLRDGRDASDIVPIELTYTDGLPMVPIQLTAVAAQPHMGIQVFILDDQAWAPANYTALEPDTTEILFDSTGVTNYFDWVARRASEANGRLWITEYVGSTTSLGLNSPYRVLSRYYTRLSPEHMTLDPVFEPNPGFTRAATLDLSARPSVQCNDFVTPLVTVAIREPARCAYNYCGDGAECTTLDDGRNACACAPGDLAQNVPGPDGNVRITCVPPENPYAVTAAAAGVGTEFDPCSGFECGGAELGKCVVKGGFPMCQCTGAALAVAAQSRPTCIPRPAAETLVFYGPGAGLESQGSTEPLNESDVEDGQTSQGNGASLLLVGLGLGGALVLRRRRKRG